MAARRFLSSFNQGKHLLDTAIESFHWNAWSRTVYVKITLQSQVNIYETFIDHRRSHLKLGALAACLLGIVVETQRPVACQERVGKSAGVRLTPKDLEPLLSPSPSNPIPVPLPPPMPGLAGEFTKTRNVAPIFGLPYRGKVFVARELRRYVEFFHGAHVEVFDLMKYKGPGGDAKLYNDLKRFFEAVPDEDVDFNAGRYSGGFAIITGTDTVEVTCSNWSAHTKFNRRWMMKELRKKLNAEVWFIQITVDDKKEEAIEFMTNLLRNRGKTLEDAKELVEEFNDCYVPLQMDGSEANVPFIELKNYTEAMMVNKIMQSYLGSRVCHFLANLHPYKHKVFLSSSGESEYEVQDRIGGDSSLTLLGREYARRLAEFSRFVVSGGATNLVCVTLTPAEVEQLPSHLTRLPFQYSSDKGLYARNDWEDDFGDASGAIVLDSMRLVRLQRSFGDEFVDAPVSLEDLLAMIRGQPATLVFVSGGAATAETIPARVWTSSLARAIETTEFLPHSVITGPNGKPWKQLRERVYRSLDEIYAGAYDGRQIQDIAERDPKILEDRRRDRLGYRYPRGESYYDVIARLDDLLTNLERVREPILIISHPRILRLVLGWLTEVSRKDSLKLCVPCHSVVKVCFDGLDNQRSHVVYPLGPQTKIAEMARHSSGI